MMGANKNKELKQIIQQLVIKLAEELHKANSSKELILVVPPCTPGDLWLTLVVAGITIVVGITNRGCFRVPDSNYSSQTFKFYLLLFFISWHYHGHLQS